MTQQNKYDPQPEDLTEESLVEPQTSDLDSLED